MAFADIIAQIEAEEDRAALSAVAEKYPTFRAVAEDGERHQSLRASMLATGVVAADKVDQAIANTPAWVKWAKDNYDFGAGMTNQEKVARAELADVRRQYDELVAKGDSDMDLDTIIAGLKEKGVFTTKEEIKNFATKEDVGATALSLTNRFESVYADLTPRAVEHATRFGEAIPMAKIFDYMRENAIADPNKAYDAYMAPKNAELASAKHLKDVSDAEQRGEAKGLAKAAEMVGRSGMPIDNGGGRKMPSFMARMMEKRGAAKGEGRLGDGTSSQAGIAAYRAKQVAGTAA